MTRWLLLLLLVEGCATPHETLHFSSNTDFAILVNCCTACCATTDSMTDALNGCVLCER